MRTLLIDDLREIAVDRVARTFLDGIAALKEGSWDLVLLDHDLGDPNPRHTGYDILCWLEQNPQFLPGEIQLVTMNPVGRDKMRVVIRRLYESATLSRQKN
jgi:hypothetical protein